MPDAPDRARGRRDGYFSATASKWVTRYKQFGEFGLLDRSSTPLRQPAATASATVTRIERMRREHKWSASRIEFELALEGVVVSRRTISRLLHQLGLNRRRFIDPNGDANREPQRIVAERPGHMVHVDVKTDEEARHPERGCLPPLRDRRAHPPRLHRSSQRREGRNCCRVSRAREHRVRGAWHHIN